MTTNNAARILIADDNPDNLRFTGEALREHGYVVMDAHDGLDALDRLEKCQPDVVVLDLLMPRLSGFVVCQRIKQSPQTKSIPIIAMSGLSDHSDKIRALELGADCFLHKPIDNLELLTAVRTVLRVRECQACQEKRKQDVACLHQELASAVGQLERALAHLRTKPDAQLDPLINDALAACKRLDQRFS